MKFTLKLFISFILCLFITVSYSKNSLVAYKIKSNAIGLIKIEANTVINSFPELTNKNPKFFHLKKNGVEYPFYILDTSSNWSGNNAIYFYTEKNTGFLDSELYDKPGANINPYYSIYGDTSIYFLSYDESKIGNYYNEKIVAQNNNAIKDFDFEKVYTYSDVYHFGKNQGSGATLSEYTLGEGYASALISLGSTKTFQIETTSINTNHNLSISTYVSGQSDAVSGNPNFNHHLTILFQGSSNSVLLDTSYKGYQCISKTFSVSGSLIAAQNSLKYSSINDLSALSDFSCVPFIKIKYKRKSSFQGLTNLKFSLENNANSSLYFNAIQLDSILLFYPKNKNFYKANITNDSIYFRIESENEVKDLFIASYKEKDVVKNFKIEKCEINEYDFSEESNELIIISSKKLSSSTNEYKQYKDLRGEKTYLVFVEDIYNSYSYGYHHPIAIKKFIDHYNNTSKTKALNLFIIGKGMQSNLYKNAVFAKRDLVPSIGIPPSDYLYVSSLDYSVVTPTIGVGRIAVENNEEVINYLDKIKENDLSTSNELWKKNIIHITGGRSLSENNLFSAALKACENVAEQPSFGANVLNFNKKVNEPISDNYREKILEETNKGISLLTYFGHGANYFVEINFGEPEALNNKGKYPVYFLNGCSVGNTSTDNSMGENYINEKESGAIGWLASSDLGFPSYLESFDRLFYESAFKLKYGESIGVIQKECIKNFLQADDTLNIIHARQFFYQGDPSFKFYSPANPDYAFTTNGVIKTNKTFNNNDSVELAFVITNTGKANFDSVEIKVERSVDNQNLVNYPLLKIPSIFNTDTFYFSIEKTKELSGNNTIKIIIDPNLKLSELSKSNNIIQKDFYISSFNPVIIQPRNSSTLKDKKITLVVHCNDIYATDIEYNVEVDTSELFNTGFKKTFKWVDQQLLKRSIDLNIDENKIIYLRVQIKGQQQTSEWITHNFIYSSGNKNCWQQIFTNQLDEKLMLNVSVENNQLEFIDNTVEFAINTRGDNARTDSVERRIRLNNNPPAYTGSNFTGISLIALHPKNLSRFSYPSIHNQLANTPDYPFEIYKYSGVFIFNTNNANDRDSLLDYLNKIPSGYVVGGFNGLNTNFQALPENILQAFETLGLSKIRTIPNGYPYAFVGYKGSAIGTATEKEADASSGIDPLKQFIRLNYTHTGKWNTGSITSEKIGPSKKWTSINWSFTSETNDDFEIEVLGIDTNNVITTLQQSALTTDSIDLSSIDALKYPYIQLKTSFSDTTNFSPPTFNNWGAIYKLPIETAVFPQHNFLLQPSKTQQGDSVNYRISFINLGEENVDSAFVTLKAIQNNGTITTIANDKILGFNSEDTISRSYKLSTYNFLGEVKLVSEINVPSEKELINYNNSFESKFYIDKDNRAPKLQVTIDGKTPMQNDLISPRPIINVSLKDENKYLLLNDSNYLQIELKRPNQSTFTKINYNDPEVSYTPATSTTNNEIKITYLPYFSEDGVYELKIKANDASNNVNSTNDYNISFEVVNASTITHFFPYPNPFTTQTQFVFTLTGEVIPEDIKIQILTISGKIVKEISKSELGNLKIGHNVTDYRWNGTDNFGDRLANGVYLYRVLIKNKNDFKQRNTSADQYFSEGYGKLYLMK